MDQGVVADRLRAVSVHALFFFFFFKQKTAYEIGLGIPAEPLFRSTLFPVRRAIMFMLVSWFGLTLPLLNAARSEERRVGKESRCRRSSLHVKNNCSKNLESLDVLFTAQLLQHVNFQPLKLDIR